MGGFTETDSGGDRDRAEGAREQILLLGDPAHIQEEWAWLRGMAGDDVSGCL